MSKILLTGDTGFLGQAFISKFGKDHEIIGIHNMMKEVPYKYHIVDITNGDVQRIIMKEHPDVVCHFAAQTGVMSSEWDIEHNLSANITGLLNVLEGCKYAGYPKIIFPSSGGTVYGNKIHARESDPLNPCNPYGITKAAGEWYIRWYNERYDIPYTILRLGNVYGPGTHRNAISTFIKHITNEGNVTLYNGGVQQKDYIYIDDVMTLMQQVLDDRNSLTLNVGTDIPTQTVSIVSKLAQLTGKTVSILHKNVESIEVTNYCLDCDKAEYMFGWHFRTNIDEGLSKCLESV